MRKAFMWMRLVCLALAIASASLEQAWAVEAVFVADVQCAAGPAAAATCN